MLKKFYLFIVMVILIYSFIGCFSTNPIEETESDNGEIPDSIKRVVMLELFVAPTCSRCPSAKLAAKSLSNKYGLDQLVILEEYAWDDPNGVYTGWSTYEIFNRFKWYSKSTKTPHAFFNGLNQNIPYYEFSLFNYEEAIKAELNRSPKVSISASYDIFAQKITINGKIYNISSGNLNKIVIGAMIYEDSVQLGNSIANHVVRDIIVSDTIDILTEGSNITFYLESENLSNVKNMDNIHIVVYVQEPFIENKEILQALYIE